MSTSERRNDVGMKIGYFVLTAIITGMLSIFFWGTYTKAEKACAMGEDNKRDTAVISEKVIAMSDIIKQINYKIDKALINGK